MGILLVIFWSGVIFLIIGTIMSTKNQEHAGTLETISKMDGMLLSEGEISDDYIVQVKLDPDLHPNHWSKFEWQVVDSIVPNPDPAVDGLLGVSKWIKSTDSGKVKYRVFKIVKELK